MVRQSALVETYITSVERLLFYSTEIPQENFDTPTGQDVMDEWPRSGAIKCDGLRVRYRHDLPEILHGVSFDIKSGSKVIAHNIS